MSKTTIQIKTYMCPLGIGNIHGKCRFHKAINDLPKDGLCPFHKLELEQVTDSLDKITLTIIGEEDIENEIDPTNIAKLKHGMQAGTDLEKEIYRERRNRDISEAIEKAREIEDK